MKKRLILYPFSLLISFAAGIATGYLYSKDKFAKMADEEIASMRDTLAKHYTNEVKSEPVVEPKKTTKKTVKKTSKKTNVSNDVEKNEELDLSKYKDETVRTDILPYVISPTEFDLSENGTDTLYYFIKNDIMADINGYQIDKRQWNNMVGDDAINHFNEYESDAVYVRNDRTGIDYEILLRTEDFFESTPMNEYIIKSDEEEDE